MSTKEPDEFRDWLKRLKKDLRKIRIGIAKHGWAIEDLRSRVEERALREQEAKQGERRRKTRKKRPRAGAARRSNVRYVREGVSNIVIVHDTDGSMVAHVENIGLAVQLKSSRRLREVLVALCRKDSRVNTPENGIVPFKTSAELIDAIKKDSGETISLNNLQNLVQALRDLLTEAEVNPDLVETGGGGYRMRLRMDGRLHEEEAG